MKKRRHEVKKGMNRNEYLSIQRLITICEGMEEPRRESGNYQHELTDIFVIILVAIICGCEGWDEIWDYAQSNGEWFSSFLSLANGIPSEATLRRVFSMLKPEGVEKVYREWILPYVGSCMNKQISIDGKTVCGVARASGEESRLHVVSAWVKEDGVSFGQIRTEEKSNEITAIPQLLDSLDVKGGTVTIDAMGCQKAIADKIVACKANYVLAVKGNQPTLMNEMKEYFAWAQTDEVERKRLSICTEEEDSRDRRVSRCITVSNDISWFEDKTLWKELRTFIRVEQTTVKASGTTKEERYYISNLERDALVFANLTRQHWAIENCLHWMLDATFHEDDSLIYSGHAPENLSVLRKIAMTMLKKAGQPKVSIRRKQRLASYNRDFLQKILRLS